VEYQEGEIPTGYDDLTEIDGGAKKISLPEYPTRLLLTLAALVIIVVGMRYASGVLNPIFVALFVVMGISPVLDWMRRRRVPAWAAITIVTVCFLALAAALGGILASYVGTFGERLDVYQAKLSEMVTNAQGWLGGHGIDTTSEYFSSLFDVERITNSIQGLLFSIVDAFNSVFLILLVILFVLAQVYSFPSRIYAKLCLSSGFETRFKGFSEVTRSYLFTKGWLALVAAILSTGVYYAFGVDFALLWGIFFFVLSFIPNFGFIISVIPPFVLTILEFGWTRAGLVLLVIVVMNTIVDNILAPRLMSRSVGLSTLAVFLSLIIWAWILGPVGALISVPLTLMVKLLVFDSYESTRFLSMFLTGGRRMISGPERRRQKRQFCETDQKQ